MESRTRGKPLSVDLENVMETVGTVTRIQHIREFDSMFNYLYLAGYLSHILEILLICSNLLKLVYAYEDIL